MNLWRVGIALVLLAMAAYVVVMNWACLLLSARNARNGIDKHHSMVPIVVRLPTMLALVAYPFSPRWWIALVPATDAATWMMLIWMAGAAWKRLVGPARR